MRLSIARLKSFALVALILASASAAGFGQQKPSAINTSEKLSGADTLTPAQVDSIISKFTAKETEFRHALNLYAFKRDALLQVLGMGGQVTGEYHRVSDFTFDDQGTRFEKINFFPMPTVESGTVTAEDLEDLGGVNPFALEAAKLSQYNFKFVGKERIDELDLYVFDVAPKVMPKKSTERMFAGRIWVDDHDLQIVKSKGKRVPETKTNKFPVVETYRQQIDGKYWFPVYAYADDDLIFDSGADLRIRMQVKYSDYKVGHAKVTITEVGEAPPGSESSSSKGTAPGEPAQPVEGGILNARALELPAPRYPATGTGVRVAGQVQVKVLIDETGKVISAEAVFGPELLRAAAVEAATRARFKPTLVAGVPVKVSGIITYDIKPQ